MPENKNHEREILIFIFVFTLLVVSGIFVFAGWMLTGIANFFNLYVIPPMIKLLNETDARVEGQEIRVTCILALIFAIALIVKKSRHR